MSGAFFTRSLRPYLASSRTRVWYLFKWDGRRRAVAGIKRHLFPWFVFHDTVRVSWEKKRAALPTARPSAQVLHLAGLAEA